MSQTRQLAAIMFTDIVGYTKLMGGDEQKAFKYLKFNRELQRPIIEQFNGRWIKEIGDGILASFNTVSNSIYAAIKILEGCNAKKEFELRIGIHLGEVVFENDDIFGDGVNIASRIQAIAAPSSIYVSEMVHDNIVNKKDIRSRFVKQIALKNVKEPVRVYRVLNKASVTDDEYNLVQQKLPLNKFPSKSIAVLPFVNMSNDPDQEYFSDGVSEEILNSLSNLKDLKVAGRTSSFQFKGKYIDIREVGEKLGVSTVMEGSVRKSGNHLRITAQLINVTDGFHIWSEKFDRNEEDIFTIQDEIALAIAEKLKITLLDSEKDYISKKPTQNRAAYELYLRGRFYWNRRGSYIIKGLQYFTEATKLDPNFGLAYSGIADTFALLGFYSMMPPLEAMPKAKAAAQRAIEIDPELVEAKTSLAFVTIFFDWDWKKGKKMLQDIISSKPNYAPVYYWYSLYLLWVELDLEGAIEMAKNGVSVEPMVAISYYYLAVAYLGSLDYEDGLRVSKEGIEIDPNSTMSFRYAGICLARLQKYDEAIESLLTAAKLSSRHQWILFDLAWVYSLVGKREEIQKIFDELQKRSATEFISSLYIGSASYFLNNIDEAYEYLEKAFIQRDAQLLSCRSNLWPVSSSLREDQRYKDFVKKINFPVI